MIGVIDKLNGTLGDPRLDMQHPGQLEQGPVRIQGLFTAPQYDSVARLQALKPKYRWLRWAGFHKIAPITPNGTLLRPMISPFGQRCERPTSPLRPSA